MPRPVFNTSFQAPSSSSSSSYSASYDYGGEDEHLKRQEMLAGQRDTKFQSLYGGDVAGSVTAQNRIRDLVKALRMHAPGTTERDPMQTVRPLARVTSESRHDSDSFDGGGVQFGQQPDPQPLPPPADLPPPGAVMGVDRRMPGRNADNKPQFGIA